MKLRHDNALGTVNDKGAGFGHQRQIAHVDFLLLDVLHGLDLGGTFLVINNQADFHPQRRAIRHATKLALFHIENGLAQFVTDIFQGSIA